VTKRTMGMMLFEAPASVNHGLAFARVIVALLGPAQAPQLEHLWVFADDDRADHGDRDEHDDGQNEVPKQESHQRGNHNAHPDRQAQAEFLPGFVEGLIDRQWLSTLGCLHGVRGSVR
jgi:hypothetical protein